MQGTFSVLGPPNNWPHHVSLESPFSAAVISDSDSETWTARDQRFAFSPTLQLPSTGE